MRIICMQTDQSCLCAHSHCTVLFAPFRSFDAYILKLGEYTEPPTSKIGHAGDTRKRADKLQKDTGNRPWDVHYTQRYEHWNDAWALEEYMLDMTKVAWKVDCSVLFPDCEDFAGQSEIRGVDPDILVQMMKATPLDRAHAHMEKVCKPGRDHKRGTEYLHTRKLVREY